MSGNLCRCGAYNGIVAAVRQANAQIAEEGPADQLLNFFTLTCTLSPTPVRRTRRRFPANSPTRPHTKILGGGTNLLDLMKMGVERPQRLVDITRLPLAKIEELPAGGVRIGALARNSDVAEHPLITRNYPVLSQALLAGASPQLRNAATTGGNLLAAHALLLFLRSCVPGLQQTHPRQRLRGD